jgi:hypothetical protein
LKFDRKKLLSVFTNVKKITNIEVIKCYKLLFSNEGFKLNYGNYIMIGIILISISIKIIFYLKGYNLFLKRIQDIFDTLGKEKENKKVEGSIQSIGNEKKLQLVQLGQRKLSMKGNKKRKKSVIKKKKKSFEFDNCSVLKEIIKKDNITFEKNDYELNSLDYENALKYDSRTYIQYYISLIRIKHLIVFTFFTKTDYNSRLIKIILFLTSFALFFCVNTLFFNDSTMHQIYKDNGNFNFIFQIPQILYSSIISSIIKLIISNLSLTEKKIVEIKEQKTLELIEKKKN